MNMERSQNYIEYNEYIKLDVMPSVLKKVLSLTQYETLRTLIGYCIIANHVCKHSCGVNTTGLAITLNESRKGSASPFIQPQ